MGGKKRTRKSVKGKGRIEVSRSSCVFGLCTSTCGCVVGFCFIRVEWEIECFVLLVFWVFSDL